VDKGKYVRYRPKGLNWCVEPADEFVRNFEDIFCDETGEWELEIIEMSHAEYKSLPEFCGF